MKEEEEGRKGMEIFLNRRSLRTVVEPVSISELLHELRAVDGLWMEEGYRRWRRTKKETKKKKEIQSSGWKSGGWRW